MDERVGGVRRAVRDQPLVGLLEGRSCGRRSGGTSPRSAPPDRELDAGHLVRVDRVEAGEEAAEVADEHRPGGGELVVAQDPARRSSRPETRRITSPVVPSSVPSSSASTSGTRSPARRHARIASASRRMTPGGAGRPGGSRRRMSSSPSAVNDHVSRDAPPVSRCSPPISTGRRARARARRRAAQMPALVPTGTSSTTWSRYSDRPAPARSPHDQRVMPSVMRVTMPSRRLRNGMFDQTSPSSS